MTPSPWIMRRPGAGRRLRLFCFAYAGGSATAFLPWQAAVDPTVEICAIQLPGRGARMGEAPPADFAQLVRVLTEEIARHRDLPFAFFGHSLGALLAFEVARHGALRRFPAPVQLIVSGCDAPQSRAPSRQLHLLPDDELIQALRDYNGSPAEVLADRELMALILPTIRADFALAERYSYRPGLRLNLPMTVFAGREDDHCKLEQVTQWERETSGPCAIDWFDGDHFFIHAQRDAVLARIGAALEQCQAA